MRELARRGEERASGNWVAVTTGSLYADTASSTKPQRQAIDIVHSWVLSSPAPFFTLRHTRTVSPLFLCVCSSANQASWEEKRPEVVAPSDSWKAVVAVVEERKEEDPVNKKEWRMQRKTKMNLEEETLEKRQRGGETNHTERRERERNQTRRQQKKKEEGRWRKRTIETKRRRWRRGTKRRDETHTKRWRDKQE